MTYSTANAQQLKSLKGEIFELEVQKIVKTIQTVDKVVRVKTLATFLFLSFHLDIFMI